MNRILALDVGTRRIGLAISDPLGISAQAAGCIERHDPERTFGTIRAFVKGRGVAEIVVGLPLDLDGSEGRSAGDARSFARELSRQLHLPVKLWDERLTTAEAERIMKSAGLPRKKRTRSIDQAAAQIILQSYLDASRGGGQTPSVPDGRGEGRSIP